MAHWHDVAVTSDGVGMLNEMMAGHHLQLTSAYGGTGVVDTAALGNQTAMVDQKQKLTLINEQDGPDGKTVTVQITSVGNSAEYLLRQIGVYAKLDMEGAEEKLLFVMQDEGVVIPDETEENFLLEIYCTLRIGKNAKLTVTIDPTGIVTLQRMKDALDKYRTLWEDSDPTAATVGTVGQHYLNIVTKKEFVCVAASEEGYIWQASGANTADDITVGGKPLTEVLGTVEPEEGTSAPTEQTAGVVGQKYTDTSTGTVYTCIAVSLGEDGGTRYTWVEGSLGTLADIRTALLDVSTTLEHKADLELVSNPNLLDNWYFADPINQRGQKTYTGIGYCIDRWRSWLRPDNEITVNDGYVTVKAQIAQVIENNVKSNLIGKQATISVLLNSGVLLSASGVVLPNSTGILLGTANTGNQIILFLSPEGEFSFQINIWNNIDIDVKAAKLELGPIQTLAHKEGDTWILNDAPPNKALELAKCQRYYIPEKAEWTVGGNVPGSGLILTIPSVLRTTPALAGMGNKVYSGSNWIEKQAIGVFQYPTYTQIMYGHDAAIITGPILFERQPALDADL